MQITAELRWDTTASNSRGNILVTMTKYNSININDFEGEEEEGALITHSASTSSRNSHPQDHLTPPFSSSDRPSNLLVGSFNLIATIVGGGVLSLPIVFCKMGIFFTVLAMILSAYMTQMSLVMLCYCSRRAGGSSYGEVVRSAFGEKMEEGVSWLLFVFLVFVIMGYMVLIRDIWTPLVASLVNYYLNNHPSTNTNNENNITGFDTKKSENIDNDDDGIVYQEAVNIIKQKQNNMTTTEMNSDYVLMAIIVFLLPFLFQRSLHALRWNCYIGFASVMILCIALVRGGWQRFHDEVVSDDDDNISISPTAEDDEDLSIQWFKIPTLGEVLFSFPIVTCSFLCHFNIISIQNSLTTPTRQRTWNLIQYAIIATFILMTLFGTGGYLYAGADVEGNILLNVPMGRSGGDVDDEEYWLFLLGRVGCGTTLMLAMPLMALPCREALLEVIDVLFHRSHHRKNTPVVIGDDENNLQSIENEGFCWRLCHKCNKTESIQDVILTTEDEVMEIRPHLSNNTTAMEENGSGSLGRSSVIKRDKPIDEDWIFRNSFAHYSTTLLIVAMCYFGAVKVRGVAVVWNFIGSSMAFFIAFILPCGCFIVIEREVPTIEEGGDRRVGWIRVSWVILVFSVIGAIICTLNSLAQILSQ
mmetsp:Transcript_31343/g.66522  ORF Transcript_31343/g.66522 Transcript_31343/m.66522 type:complete len:643 (-) Transcript_31343:92-2020(-)